jgi:hypothetical protein
MFHLRKKSKSNNKNQLSKSSNNLLKKELEEKIIKQKELLAKLNKERDNVKNITSTINTFVKDLGIRNA